MFLKSNGKIKTLRCALFCGVEVVAGGGGKQTKNSFIVDSSCGKEKMTVILRNRLPRDSITGPY